MQGSTLTFERGKFKFLRAPRKDLNLSLWEQFNETDFQTSSLKAAALFRDKADRHTEGIFQKVFQEHYVLPQLPQLSFLDRHQVEGIKWILGRKRSYLAHAPGAGKTAQAIIAAICSGALDEGQVLFIVPPTLTANWAREIRHWVSHTLGLWVTIGICGTSATEGSPRWTHDFVIVPDSMLAKDRVQKRIKEMNIFFLAVDEASRFKEPTSERTQALFGGGGYSGIFQNAEHTVLLDGSPMPNRPMELWAPTFAMHPEAIDCMEQQDFGFRYCGAKMNERGQWEFKHASNETELKKKLQADFMHVVTESQLAHPERRRSLLFMSTDVRSPAHKSWERRHLGRVSLSDLDEKMNRGDIATFRQELGMRKIEWVASYVRERLAQKNESILLFAWHRGVCEGLAKALEEFNPGLVMGGTKERDREKYFDEFQRGQRRLIVANIAASGRGHNLQKADRVIFAEFSWSDELNRQCEKRASRRGRDVSNVVRCEYVVAPGSMDEVIGNALFTKAKRVTQVIG